VSAQRRNLRADIAAARGLGYDRIVAATLKTLDVHPMYIQSDDLVKHFREAFATPLGYSPPKHHPNCLVDAEVLPDDIRKNRFFLYFHIDSETRTDRKYQILRAHLRYRPRPSGPIPQLLKSLREQGLTIAWVEKLMPKTDNPVFFVEAKLALPSEERPGVRLSPPVSIGGSTLKKCGEEYRADKTVVGKVETFRWSEKGPGKVSVWLNYSHPGKAVASIWDDEEIRCRSLLQQLV
jgi:hypothetical protein